jgi:hypothetical protein
LSLLKKNTPMPLHLIKLSEGSESLADLAAWQKARLKDMKAKGKKPELIHITRQTPKRAEEVLDGAPSTGSSRAGSWRGKGCLNCVP